MGRISCDGRPSFEAAHLLAELVLHGREQHPLIRLARSRVDCSTDRREKDVSDPFDLLSFGRTGREAGLHLVPLAEVERDHRPIAVERAIDANGEATNDV
jgi:hypothetical protein